MRICQTALFLTGLTLLAGACRKDGPSENPESGPSLAETFSEWPAYQGIDYDFLQDYEMPPMPTRNMTGVVSGEAWRYDDRWFTFVQGKRANGLVKEKEASAKRMLEQLNEDFAYLRDEMGWLPDRNAMEGYRSAVYLYGSGLGTDNEPNTATGGWQGSVYRQGKEYPMLLLSYYPVYCFDPACNYADKDYHTYNVTHEGIHCLFSSRPGGKKISWFHEGCDVWLQRAMNIRRGTTAPKDIEFGWLASGTLLAPFIPIECYGGWKSDGTWGPPDWMMSSSGDNRRILGGVQYSEVFPSFMEISVGDGAIKWIWEHCQGYLLESLAGSSPMGHDQVKRMILEFRSRVALCDLGIYSDAARKLSDQYFGTVVESEGSHKCDPWKMTPYVETYPTDQGWIIPENSTLPGWTGANVIPIKVKGDKATVSFEAVKQPAINGNYEPLDLVCQLCWRTTDGRPVYAQPFEDGDCTVSLAGQQPANGVIFAVVCNRTYRFKPVLLKTKYWYKLKLGEGTDGTASTQTKWFNYDQKLS
jgi:hypothetical protein